MLRTAGCVGGGFVFVREQVRFADKNYIKLKDVSNRVNMQQSGLGVSFPLPERHVAGNGGYRPECGRWAGHRATVLERLASLWQNGEMAVFVFPC